MRPPKSFVVGNRVFTLDFDQDPDSPKDGVVWGSLDPVSSTLVLNPDMQPRQMAEILVHELLHAVYAGYWYDIRPKNAHHSEEFFVTTGSRGIVEVFDRNPRLFQWWQYLMAAKDNI